MRVEIAGLRRALGMALAGVAAMSCGSITPVSPTAATGSGSLQTFPQTIMIEGGRPIPEELTVAVGERVSFMNHDRTTYTIGGGSVPSSSGCAEIDSVGVLTSGDLRTTEAFSTARTCEFHVSQDDSTPSVGRITIR
jgi:hypothetical protein